MEELEGMITAITLDARPVTSPGEAALVAEMTLSYYRSTWNNEELACIIPAEFVRRIHGVDRLAGIRNIIRI
ncbi:phage major tail tube protein [Citrobacter sp. CtB7.12]|uniref:phage major tail tube protein n=1 Tax=Citrobacter sp. CtB7.12 TaxID=1696093 RepID=UPI002101B015|nr:phage major tail tube protein [Citrobacter sp. CtB7.12]